MAGNIPTVEQLLAQLSPLPLAEGTVTAYATGWTTAYYYDPLTNLQVTFVSPPTVVATAETRGGSVPAVSAPTINIPSIQLPVAPEISIPSVPLPGAPSIQIPQITLPSLPTITIPDWTADENALIQALENLQGYRFTNCGAAIAPVCNALNDLMKLWDTAIGDLITAIVDIGSAFFQAKQNLQALINGVSALHDDAQSALNTYQGNIQSSINSALTNVQSATQTALNAYRDNIQSSLNSAMQDWQTKAQAALNSYQSNIQDSLNKGLSQIIPALYDQIGVPLSELITPVQIRNVTPESFEFYALSPGYTIHYVAVGVKA
jgi:Skp family chaperone for outer membrane proteins